MRTVIECFDYAKNSKPEPSLNSEQDLAQFYSELDKLRQSHHFIQTSGLKNGEALLQSLRAAIVKASQALEQHFRKQLQLSNQQSPAVDVLRPETLIGWNKASGTAIPSSPSGQLNDDQAIHQIDATTPMAPSSDAPLISTQMLTSLKSIAAYLSRIETDPSIWSKPLQFTYF